MQLVEQTEHTAVGRGQSSTSHDQPRRPFARDHLVETGRGRMANRLVDPHLVLGYPLGFDSMPNPRRDQDKTRGCDTSPEPTTGEHAPSTLHYEMQMHLTDFGHLEPPTASNSANREGLDAHSDVVEKFVEKHAAVSLVRSPALPRVSGHSPRSQSTD